MTELVLQKSSSRSLVPKEIISKYGTHLLNAGGYILEDPRGFDSISLTHVYASLSPQNNRPVTCYTSGISSRPLYFRGVTTQLMLKHVFE